MNLEQFDAARASARKAIHDKGFLTFGEVRLLVSLTEHDASVSQRDSALFRVLLEIACAERSLPRWVDVANQYFSDLPGAVLENTKEFLGRPPNSPSAAVRRLGRSLLVFGRVHRRGGIRQRESFNVRSF